MRRFLRRFVHAGSGFIHFVRSEANARFHLIASVLALGLGFYLKLPMSEMRWLMVAIAAVISTELLNSAIERLADKVSPERDPLIKQSKDMAAAAVLICSIFALVVGATIFIPRFL